MCCTSSNLRPENAKLEERTNKLGIAYNHAYSLLRAQGIISPFLTTTEVGFQADALSLAYDWPILKKRLFDRPKAPSSQLQLENHSESGNSYVLVICLKWLH